MGDAGGGLGEGLRGGARMAALSHDDLVHLACEVVSIRAGGVVDGDDSGAAESVVLLCEVRIRSRG